MEKEICIEERDETRVELLDTSLIDLYFHYSIEYHKFAMSCIFLMNMIVATNT